MFLEIKKPLEDQLGQWKERVAKGFDPGVATVMAQDLYRKLGLETPAVLVVGSPASAAMAMAAMESGKIVPPKAQELTPLNSKIGDQAQEDVVKKVHIKLIYRVNEDVWRKLEGLMGPAREFAFNPTSLLPDRSSVSMDMARERFAATGPDGGKLRLSLKDEGGETTLPPPADGWCRVGSSSLFSYFADNYDETAIQMAAFVDFQEAVPAFAVWYMRAVVVICEPPVLHTIEAPDGRATFHRDGGPAIEFPDGLCQHYLNGVRVPPWLAETPVEKLDPKEFAKIENVEIRREFVRKIGIERLCSLLGTKTLDKKTMRFKIKRPGKVVGGKVIDYTEVERPCRYELVLVNLGEDVGEWPYLKMENVSVEGVYHMECVGKRCRTVEEALAFRNGTKDIPEQLS